MVAISQDIFGRMVWNSGVLLRPPLSIQSVQPRKTRKRNVVSERRDNSETDRRGNGPDSYEAREQECIAATCGGDPEAFDFLVDCYSARIYRHLYRLVKNREEAEDLTQETFLRAYRFFDRYDTARPFRSWLYTIATNLGRNAIRAQRRRGYPLQLDDDAQPHSRTVIAQEKTLRDATAAELRDRLAKAVGRLPEKSSMLIRLHYAEQMTVREASEIVGMTESAAKVALHRARKTLREWFAGNPEL